MQFNTYDVFEVKEAEDTLTDKETRNLLAMLF
jgi:hypothetical protein